MIIALASPRVATSLDDALLRIERLIADAAAQRAEIVCFPEAYVPGLRSVDIDVFSYDREDEERTLAAVAGFSRSHCIATILGIERIADEGRQVAAVVVDSSGAILGCQTKNQLDPSEDAFYVPGTQRAIFEVNGVTFGIAICHEGWRYPETVRWAAVRGAKIVFHPQHTGSNSREPDPSAYYEKAMMMRSIENHIWFASVNYALRYPESVTTIIAPDGRCYAQLPSGSEGVLVRDIDVDEATGTLAKRFAPERYA